MWTSVTHHLPPIVWSILFPAEVRNHLVSENNKKGDITNWDLELTGMLLGWLVLEARMKKVQHCHLRIFCDNTPTTAWMNRLISKRSIIAGRILHAIELWQWRSQVSPLLTFSIAGEKNDISEVMLQDFQYEEHKTLTDNQPSLAHHLKIHFLLPQKQQRQECRLHNVTTTALISELLGR